MLDRPAVGSCCSVIDSGRGPYLFVIFLHSSLPYRWILREGLRRGAAPPLWWMVDVSNSARWQTDTITALNLSPAAVPLIKTDAPWCRSIKTHAHFNAKQCMFSSLLIWGPSSSHTPSPSLTEGWPNVIWLKSWALVMSRRMTMQCWFITKRGHSNPCFSSVTWWQAWGMHWWWDWDAGESLADKTVQLEFSFIVIVHLVTTRIHFSRVHIL